TAPTAPNAPSNRTHRTYRTHRTCCAFLPIPPRHRWIEAADVETGGAGAAGADGELDAETAGRSCHPPQRARVVDEHRDGLVGGGTPGRHRHRLGVIDRHMNGAAAIAVEVASLEHQVAAAAPGRMVAEDQADEARTLAVGIHVLDGIDGGRELSALAGRRVVIGPERGQ